MAGIETLISKPVWDAIKDNYEKSSYTTAITNLLIYVQDVVREKSGLEFDGTSLMDKAFLGDKPVLQINKLETKTEKDIQSGIGYILKGLCLAIRNPVSNDLIEIFDDYDDCINNEHLVNGLEKYITNNRERDNRVIELVYRKIKYENNSKWKSRFEKIYNERILGETSQDVSDTETFADEIPF